MIGHTKSGKPVYQSFGQQQNFGTVAGWTADDHHDAAELHHAARDADPNGARAKTHGQSAVSHIGVAGRIYGAVDRMQPKPKHKPKAKVARAERKADEEKRNTDTSESTKRLFGTLPMKKSEPFVKLLKSIEGEGSRGGKVIGHTKSGKPIYLTDLAHFKKYTKDVAKDPTDLAHGTKLFEKVVAHVAVAHPDFTAQDHEDAAKVALNHYSDNKYSINADGHDGAHLAMMQSGAHKKATYPGGAHPEFGHADMRKLTEPVIKKWRSGVKAYLKHHQAVREGDDASVQKMRTAHDKLYKITNEVDDRGTREHLFNHIEGKHEGALPTKVAAMESGSGYRKEMNSVRVDRLRREEVAEKVAAAGGGGDTHYAVAARQHQREMDLAKIKKSVPNVRRIGAR